MLDDIELKERGRRLVSEATPVDEEGQRSQSHQRIRGRDVIAVQGSHNHIEVGAAHHESYGALLTAQLVQEERRLSLELDDLEQQRAAAAQTQLIATLGPPVLGLLTLNHLPAGLMMVGVVIALVGGIVGGLWGVQRVSQVVGAKQVIAAKLEAVRAHLTHRSNWHP